MIQRTILAFSLSAIAMSSQAGFYEEPTPPPPPPPISPFTTAIDINPYFTTEFSPDIGDSAGNNTSLEGPWVTIAGKGNGANDYFSFDVSTENRDVRLDIDYTMDHPSNPNGFDSQVALWRQVGAGTYSLIGMNDDYDVSAGAGGSVHHYDSFLSVEAPVGHYIAGVTQCCSEALDTGLGSGPWSVIPYGREYTLQVQVGEVDVVAPPIPEPETYAMLLAGLGLLGFMARRKNNAT